MVGLFFEIKLPLTQGHARADILRNSSEVFRVLAFILSQGNAFINAEARQVFVEHNGVEYISALQYDVPRILTNETELLRVELMIELDEITPDEYIYQMTTIKTEHKVTRSRDIVVEHVYKWLLNDN